MENGDTVSPRGYETKEVVPLTVISEDPRERYIDRTALNASFMLRESSDIFNGLNPGYVCRYNSVMNQFKNKFGNFDGAYGPRIRFMSGHDQLERVVEELEKDPDSRRAVITIHNSLFENYSGKDVACTMSLQYLVRDGKLDSIAHMRSNDMLLGFTYDTHAFQWLQEVIAGFLGLELGSYTHIDNSAHIYSRNFDAVDSIIRKYESIYENGFEPLSALVDRKTFEKDWDLKEKVEELGRNHKFDEALEIMENGFLTDYYKAWAGVMVFADAYRAERKDVCTEILEKDFVKNEWKKWLLRKHEA